MQEEYDIDEFKNMMIFVPNSINSQSSIISIYESIVHFVLDSEHISFNMIKYIKDIVQEVEDNFQQLNQLNISFQKYNSAIMLWQTQYIKNLEYKIFQIITYIFGANLSIYKLSQSQAKYELILRLQFKKNNRRHICLLKSKSKYQLLRPRPQMISTSTSLSETSSTAFDALNAMNLAMEFESPQPSPKQIKRKRKRIKKRKNKPLTLQELPKTPDFPSSPSLPTPQPITAPLNENLNKLFGTE